MEVKELTRDQIIELKQRMLTEEKDVSYGELLAADVIVPDKAVYEHFAGIDFVEDDFFCTAS